MINMVPSSIVNNIGLIISDDSDRSTNKVISYLLENNDFKIVRLSRENYNSDLLREVFNRLLIKDGYAFIWLKKSNFPEPQITAPEYYPEIKILRRHMHMLAESSKTCLGSVIKEYDHNKLNDIFLAKSYGIKVPKTLIAFDKHHAIQIVENNPNIKFITKSINDPVIITNKEFVKYGGFTSQVSIEDIRESEFSIPSLLQEEIEKVYEIRSFYINGMFYSMAIFSQSDEQTKVDFRHYNHSSPNRNIPFKLPEYMEERLTNLMKKMQLDTGSIDLIYSKDNEFYFLEVNPCGHFGFVSENCNYNIERHIANVLKNKKNG